jgi:nucleotide-binding universal stress UspA family protein
VRPGPVLIGYDGTAAAERALRETSELLRGRKALVVVVYKAGLVFELVALPASRGVVRNAPCPALVVREM